MQSRNEPNRRPILTSRSDRIMLQAIKDNLRHVVPPQTCADPGQARADPGQARADPGQARADPVQNGIAPAIDRVGGLGKNAARHIYHKKAMHQIRQSLKGYQIDSNSPQQMTQQQAKMDGSLQGHNNLVRSVMVLGPDEETARQAITLCPSRNVDKVVELADCLAASREGKNGYSRLNVPIYGTKVLRKPSFEEKYRTSSPANSDNQSSSRSDSPAMSLGHTNGNGELYSLKNGPCNLYNTSIVYERNGDTGAFRPVTHNGGIISTNQPHELSGVLSSRGRSPIVVNNRMRQRNVVPAGQSSVQSTVPFVSQIATSVPSNASMQDSAYGRTTGSISPTSSHSPSPASTPSSGNGEMAGHYSRLVPLCAYSRHNVMQQVVRSKEVQRPIPQQAIAPPVPQQPTAACVPSIQVEFSRNNYSMSPAMDHNNRPTIQVYIQKIPHAEEGNDNYYFDPSRISPAPATYPNPSLPTRYQQNFASRPVSQSPISVISSDSSPSTNSDFVDLPPPPPPPYPSNDAASGNGQQSMPDCSSALGNFNHRTSVDGYFKNEPFAHDDCEYNGGSSDRLDAIVTDGAVSEEEAQLIESPKPVRRSDACQKDAERNETQIRHFSSQAFCFYMEQHIENVHKWRVQRMNRQMQLEKEMSQVNLPPDVQSGIRKMLVQKESNYLRLRRAKMDRSMFERIKPLGTGAFGKVDLVRKKGTRALYALKTLCKKDVLNRNQVAHVKAERDILAEADNEWVVKLYYSFQDQTNLYIVMDYIPGGDMMGLLIKLGIFEQPLAEFYISELVLAIESVHKMGFIHRDIKPDNILIGKDGHIKLTDFGLCTGFRWTHDSKYYQKGNHLRVDSMEQSENWDSDLCHCNSEPLKKLERRHLRHQRCMAHSLVGTPNYIAPEVLQRAGYTACCDWWSVGVILYEMRVGHPPFYANTTVETQRKVINWPLTLHIPEDSYLSPETSDLILSLCCGVEERLGRNGADQVKSHPFFSHISFQTLRQQQAPYIPPLLHPTDTSNFDPVEPDRMRRSASLDSLLKEGTYDGGKHAFLEFTFRRFFDDDGHAQAMRINDPDMGEPVYV